MCNKILLSDFWCVRAKASDMYEIEMQEMWEAFFPCWKAAAIHLDMQAHKYVFYICPSHPITYASQLRNDGTIKVISNSVGSSNMPPDCLTVVAGGGNRG